MAIGRRLVSYHVDFSIGLLECSHEMVVGFSHSKRSRNIKEEATMCFMMQPYKPHMSFLQYLNGYTS